MTSLVDLDHYFGNDLSATAGGDIATVQGITKSQQRILRRLLTNPGTYKWHPNYGAGVPQWIGRTAEIPELQALIKGQMLLEASVAPSPAPTVAITAISNSNGGGFAVQINYTEADSGQAVALAFNVSN